jgi:hypothetical protein
MAYKEQFSELVKKLPQEKDQENFLALFDALEKRDELNRILRDDFLKAYEILDRQNEDQYLRRTTTRTSFALIEGTINNLNTTVLDAYKYGFITLTQNEIEKLEERKQLENGGSRPFFLPLEKKVEFSIIIYAQKIGNIDFKIDSSSPEWKKFKFAIEIRNHLTHPKSLKDIEINEEKISLVLDSTLWFIVLCTDLHKKNYEIMKMNSIATLVKGRIKGIQLGK